MVNSACVFLKDEIRDIISYSYIMVRKLPLGNEGHDQTAFCVTLGSEYTEGHLHQTFTQFKKCDSLCIPFVYTFKIDFYNFEIEIGSRKIWKSGRFQVYGYLSSVYLYFSYILFRCFIYALWVSWYSTDVCVHNCLSAVEVGKVENKVTITCRTDLPVEVTWKHSRDGEEIGIIKGKSFELPNLEEPDAGEYSCWDGERKLDSTYLLLEEEELGTDGKQRKHV